MTTYYIAVDYDRYDIDCSGRALSVVGTNPEEVHAAAVVKYQLVECIVAEPCTELLYREVLERGAPRDYGYDETTNLLCTVHEAQERELAEAITWNR